jgi:hypothetical protein
MWCHAGLSAPVMKCPNISIKTWERRSGHPNFEAPIYLHQLTSREVEGKQEEEQ